MSTTTRATCRIVHGVRFIKGADGVYRGEAFGRSLWAWNGGVPGDPTWHWGFAPKSTTGQGLGEDRNRGTRGTRDEAMHEAVAWAADRWATDKNAAAEADPAWMQAAKADAEQAMAEAAEDAEMLAGMVEACKLGPAIAAAKAAEGAALADAEMQAKGYQAGPAVAEHAALLAEAPAVYEIKHTGSGLFIVRSINAPAPRATAGARARLANRAPALLDALRELLEFADNGTSLHPGSLAWEAARAAVRGLP